MRVSQVNVVYVFPGTDELVVGVGLVLVVAFLLLCFECLSSSFSSSPSERLSRRAKNPKIPLGSSTTNGFF